MKSCRENKNWILKLKSKGFCVWNYYSSLKRVDNSFFVSRQLFLFCIIFFLSEGQRIVDF